MPEWWLLDPLTFWADRDLDNGEFLKTLVQAAEERLCHAEQNASPSPAVPPEDDKQQAAPTSKGGTASTTAEVAAADKRQAQLHAIASDLLYWKGGLKVLRQAQLPKWRGYFKWQIEARIEALQTAYAMLQTEAAKRDR